MREWKFIEIKFLLRKEGYFMCKKIKGGEFICLNIQRIINYYFLFGEDEAIKNRQYIKSF